MSYRARRRKKSNLLWFKTQFVGRWRADVQRRPHVGGTLRTARRIRTTHRKEKETGRKSEKEREKRKKERK